MTNFNKPNHYKTFPFKRCIIKYICNTPKFIFLTHQFSHVHFFPLHINSKKPKLHFFVYCSILINVRTISTQKAAVYSAKASRASNIYLKLDKLHPPMYYNEKKMPTLKQKLKAKQ